MIWTINLGTHTKTYNRLLILAKIEIQEKMVHCRTILTNKATKSPHFERKLLYFRLFCGTRLLTLQGRGSGMGPLLSIFLCVFHFLSSSV